jgi:hypothetical protein
MEAMVSRRPLFPRVPRVAHLPCGPSLVSAASDPGHGIGPAEETTQFPIWPILHTIGPAVFSAEYVIRRAEYTVIHI